MIQMGESTLESSMGEVGDFNGDHAGSAEPAKTFVLEANQELRFEVPFGKVALLKLLSGTAEIFGTELGPSIEYTICGRKLAVFSWNGCRLSLAGDAAVTYVVGDTPMASYLNTHLALEAMRRQPGVGESIVETIPGPRVLVVGPPDVGKTTLSKLLLNYAVRMQHKPLFVDLDTNEGSLSVPGTMAATPITRPISIEEDFSSVLNEVVAYYYGYPTPIDKPKLYERQMDMLATAVAKKLELDSLVRTSGIIINTPSQFVEGAGFELLISALEKFKVTAILVLSHERLYADLTKKLQGRGISIIKLYKSGGVVNRDKAYRKALTNAKIKEYFYGTPKYDLHPYREILKFDYVRIRRVGEGAPSSMLPMGMVPLMTETRYVKVEPGDILLHSILAVTNLEENYSTGERYISETDAESEAIMRSSLAGFIYVSEVDEKKRKLTVLSPTPGRGQRRFIVMGALKWLET